MNNSCDKIIEIIERLLGPGGCPWDQEQTLLTLRASVLEEVCELIDAINSGDKHHIQEELGDLLLNALFLARIAEKENVCTFKSVVDELADKLIRRHPHVFEEAKALSTESVLHQWDQIKKTEKGKDTRTGPFDGIPGALPSLARGQKMCKRLTKNKLQIPSAVLENASPISIALWDIIQQASRAGVDAEQELRHFLGQIEASCNNFDLK